MAWTLKTTEEGGAVVQDGLPVFVDDDGKEMPIDPNQMHTKILELNSESKGRRQKLQDLQGRLEAVKDIENLEEFITNARTAMETVGNLEDSQLVQAGEVEKIKQQALAAQELTKTKLQEEFGQRETKLTSEIEAKDATIRKLMISNQFAQHDLFAGAEPRTVLPPDIAEQYFGRFFDVDYSDGDPKVVAKDAKGEVILSREPGQIGEPANFNEAMEMVFSNYPGKERLLRAGLSGSGATGGSELTGGTSPAAQIKQKLAAAKKAGDGAAQMRLTMQLSELQAKS